MTPNSPRIDPVHVKKLQIVFLFEVRYSQTICQHSFLLLAELRDDIADIGLAVSLPDAIEDVFDAVQDLLR